MKTTKTRKKQHRRDGFSTAIALICLMLASLLAGSLIRTTLRNRQTQRNVGLRVQALWLAESALGRARAQLARQPDYSGETWTPPLGEFRGRAVIHVVKEKDSRRIEVEASYPADAARRATHRLEWTPE